MIEWSLYVDLENDEAEEDHVQGQEIDGEDLDRGIVIEVDRGQGTEEAEVEVVAAEVEVETEIEEIVTAKVIEQIKVLQQRLLQLQLLPLQLQDWCLANNPGQIFLLGISCRPERTSPLALTTIIIR